MTNAYADLTVLKSSGMLNITSSSFDTRLLALLEEVSHWTDAYCNRHFYVLTATRRFDSSGGWELLTPDLISVTALKTDEDQDRVFETTWSSGDYLLYPLNAQPQQPWGRPYSRIVVDTIAGGRSAFSRGLAVVEISGQWGYQDIVEDSGADINEGGTFGASDATLTVTDGSKFAVGQTLRIDSEQLYVTAIATNDLTVVRGVSGTAAATHDDGTDIYLYRYPAPVVEACLLQAARLWKRKDSVYSDQAATRWAGNPVDVVVGLDKDVRRLLSPYRRIATGAGV